MCGEVSVIRSSASCHVALMTTPMGRGVIDKAGVHVSDENRSAFSKSNNMKCTSGSETFCIVHEHRTSDALPSCVVWRRASVFRKCHTWECLSVFRVLRVTNR